MTTDAAQTQTTTTTETPSNGTVTTPPPTTPATTTAPGGTTGETQAQGATTTAASPTTVTFTPEQQAWLNAKLAEERRDAERKATDSAEAKDAKRKAAEYDKLVAAQQTAEERLTAERDALKAERDRLAATATALRLAGAFREHATEKGLTGPKLRDAVQWADLSGVRFNDDGVPNKQDIARAFDAFIADGREDWLAPPAAPTYGGQSGTNGALTREQQIEQARREMRASGSSVRLT